MIVQRLAKTMVARRSDSHSKTCSCLRPPSTERDRDNLRISRAQLPHNGVGVPIRQPKLQAVRGDQSADGAEAAERRLIRAKEHSFLP